MFTSLTGQLPWVGLVNALTGWGLDDKDLLACGERIQDLRNAFNVREGIRPKDFAPPPRMMGGGDGLLEAGPLRGIQVPIERLRGDYYAAMGWNAETGKLARARAEKLGIAELLGAYVDGERAAAPASSGAAANAE
jgi:aldehyde:ferredoxin oxidoreductase